MHNISVLCIVPHVEDDLQDYIQCISHMSYHTYVRVVYITVVVSLCQNTAAIFQSGWAALPLVMEVHGVVQGGFILISANPGTVHLM